MCFIFGMFAKAYAQITKRFSRINQARRTFVPVGLSSEDFSIMLPVLRKFYSNPSILEKAKKLENRKNEILAASGSNTESAEKALEKSFTKYAEHTNIIERVAVTNETVNGIKKALEYVQETFKCGSVEKELFLNAHTAIMGEKSKNWREVDVYVRRTDTDVHIFPSFAKVPALMGGFINFLNTDGPNMHPVIRAAIAKLIFVVIHPFHDGNGRVSRTLLNGILRQEGYPFCTTVPYEECVYYYEMLQKFEDTRDLGSYFDYICSCIERSMDEYAQDL